MSKYEVKTANEWVEAGPTDELKALLDEYPNGTITINNEAKETTHWRRKPRDEQLIKEIGTHIALSLKVATIRHGTAQEMGTAVKEGAENAAKGVYDLLEQKGLV